MRAEPDSISPQRPSDRIKREGDLSGSIVRTSERLLRENIFLILGVGIVAAALSGASALWVLPKEYRANTTLMTRTRMGAESFFGRLASAMPVPASLRVDYESVQIQEYLKSQRLKQIVIDKILAKHEGLSLKNLPDLRMTASGPIIYLQARGRSPQVVLDWLQLYLEELQQSLNAVSTVQAQKASAFIGERVAEVSTDLEAIEDQLAKLRLSSGLSRGKTIESQIAKSQREYLVQSKVLEALKQQYEQAQIDSKREELMFSIIDPPLLPMKPSGPRFVVFTLMGLILGLIGSAVILFMSKLIRL